MQWWIATSSHLQSQTGTRLIRSRYLNMVRCRFAIRFVCDTEFLIVWTIEDVRAACAHWTAAGSVATALWHTWIGWIFECCNDQFPIIGNIADTIIWIEYAARLRLQLMYHRPRVGFLVNECKRDEERIPISKASIENVERRKQGKHKSLILSVRK